METTDFARHLANFLTKYLPSERGSSKNTIIAYRDTFILLFHYMEQEKHIKPKKICLNDLNKDNIVDFLYWLEISKGNSVKTRNARLAAIRSFFDYLQYLEPANIFEYQRVMSIHVKKTEKKVMKYLTTEGIRLLLKQPDQKTWRGRRDLAMIALMYDIGARVQEIADITIGSIRLSEPYTITITGKGNKTRIVPMMKEQMKLLIQYMQEKQLLQNNCRPTPLFFNSRNEKFTRAGISYILQKYLRMACQENPSLIPEGISCHSLRHSKAMHLLQAGVPLIYIRDLLGHESVVTTEVYARADSLQKRKALENAFEKVSDTSELPIWETSKDLLRWLKEL
ncbi:site-specific integrase [Bacteroides faecium]|uniref:Site-specific integrase n=1 Tax=Bacteroides faecium TaxID=2715212 RepID=A0A6H0KM15_9BACE|nr:site-specific integrase [Bacteroides faecium]QIU94259.1 site-specific integrase [Bacteroides faecium]